MNLVKFLTPAEQLCVRIPLIKLCCAISWNFSLTKIIFLILINFIFFLVTRLKVSIEFSMENPEGGIHFVVPKNDPEQTEEVHLCFSVKMINFFKM